MEWMITEKDQLSLHDIDRQGIKMLIGNGYFGYRGTLEEFTKSEKTATIISGLYDQVGDQWREPVNFPNGGFVQVIYQGQALHALHSQVLEHEQSIDMYNAIHFRRTVFAAPDGTRITLSARRFASLARLPLLCEEFTVSADAPCQVEIVTGIDGDVWDINGPHLTQMIPSQEKGIISVSALTHEVARPIAVSESVVTQQPAAVLQEEILPQAATGSIYRRLRVALSTEGVTFQKYSALHSDRSAIDPLTASRQTCQAAVAAGFPALLQEHQALWQKRWQTCDIQIEGDAVAQQALRFSMYQLLAIVPTHTETASIPARGISGQMYKGAIFWDTEIFMLPFFTHTFPEMARNLLLYRYHTLEGARRKASELGYRGAFYAWESQDSGDDACTYFNVTDVFTNRPMRTYFRDKQVHISADIPYAFWQYYTATGDESIWRDGGAEVVFECARFFLSYVYYNPDKHRYEILDVTGPDEYHERVHNNAFTNRLIAHTFDICLVLSAALQENDPEFYDSLVASLDFEADLTVIADIASNLYQPDIVPDGVIIPQFDGYFALEDISISNLLKKRLNPNEYLGGGNGLATTTQIIKQADVVLMLYLFSEQYSLATKAANWEFYEPRTEHGSSLSACSYSMIAAEIGKVEWAYQYFLKTAMIDLKGEGKQYVGTLYIGGTHSASDGGAWMAAVYGLCGIRSNGETIALHPHLPAQWVKVSVPYALHGQRLLITLTHATVTVKPLHPLTANLSVSLADAVYPLHSTGELVIPLVGDDAAAKE
jgi:trehalose/maltose hydrolase-like predicted phosphorylase